MVDIVLTACGIAFILFVWFELDTFQSYAKLFKLNKFCLIDEFESSNEISYPKFLHKKHNNFLTQLVACPVCLGFWLCFIASCLQKFSFVFFLALNYFSCITLFFLTIIWNHYIINKRK